MRNPLVQLALLGAIHKPVKISALEFATKLKTSPMTASRRLKDLEDKGLISRSLLARSQAIKITEEGISLLKNQYIEYKSIFEGKGIIELSGTITSGLGEGKYYLSIRGYMKQIDEKLGFLPYPGTLNVKLDRDSVAARMMLHELDPIRILSFRTTNRTYGGINCYTANVEGIHSAVIVPDRSHYLDDVIEVIAPVSIKHTLGKDNGDRIRVVVT